VGRVAIGVSPTLLSGESRGGEGRDFFYIIKQRATKYPMQKRLTPTIKATPCAWAARAAVAAVAAWAALSRAARAERAARTRAEGVLVVFDMPSLYASLSRVQANIFI